MTSKVQYAYADGSGNHIRPTGTTHPNGREIGYGYGAPGSMDDGLSRLAGISDGSASRASFKFLGLSTPVRTEFTEPGLCQDLWGGVPGQYSGLDPFLRVKDLRWTDGTSDRVRIKHGYDRDSNRLWRENPVAAATTHPQDQLYAYDRLNRLIQMQRGLLDQPHTGLTQRDFEQAWGLDKAGNWSRFRQDADGGGTWDLDQSRRTNKGNEIVGIGAQAGPAWATPAYDPTGNMRSFPKPDDPTGSFGAVYDAWNRLVKVTDGEATVAEYSYDARSFRTKMKISESGVLTEERDYYYSSGWQVLEERVGPNVERQHVWGLGINSLILRDRDSDGDGVIDERLYALQDAHWDVCAVADAAGNVLERYEYEAYGKPRILTPSFGTRPSSLFAWELLFQGSAMDSETGLYQVRHRYYHPVLGSWITRDPLFDHWGRCMIGRAHHRTSVKPPSTGGYAAYSGTGKPSATACRNGNHCAGNQTQRRPRQFPVFYQGSANLFAFANAAPALWLDVYGLDVRHWLPELGPDGGNVDINVRGESLCVDGEPGWLAIELTFNSYAGDVSDAEIDEFGKVTITGVSLDVIALGCEKWDPPREIDFPPPRGKERVASVCRFYAEGTIALPECPSKNEGVEGIEVTWGKTDDSHPEPATAKIWLDWSYSCQHKTVVGKLCCDGIKDPLKFGVE